MARIVGRTGPFKGVSIPLPAEGLTLGRGAPGDGRLAFDARCNDISRSHCRVQFDERAQLFKLTDLGSSNGTFLNPGNRRLVPHETVECEAGVRFQMGRYSSFDLIADTGHADAAKSSARSVDTKYWSLATGISFRGLIEGFTIYIRTTMAILRHPLDFPKSLDVEGEKAFHGALSFILYATVLTFVLLVPVLSQYTSEITKSTFLIRSLVPFVMYCGLLHLGLRIIGRSKRKFRSTAIVYAYISGVFFPLSVISLYPILMSFGPDFLYLTVNDDNSERLVAFFENHSFLSYYFAVIFWMIAFLSVVIFASWFPRTHQVSKTKAVLCLFLTGFVGQQIQIFFLDRLSLELSKWLKIFAG